MKAGQTVEVALEALDRRLTARVSEIVPAVDAASRSYIVKIDLPALPNLRSGMFGRAWFPHGRAQSADRSGAAVVERGQLQSVFVVEDGSRAPSGHHRRKRPKAWRCFPGLSEGEKVVSPIPAGLADGARVEVRQ